MYEKMKARVNWPITILLFVGLLTVAFPLYMTIVIAFKQPSRDDQQHLSGILSLPAQWSLSNFAQAMELTDFWRSLGNSLLVTVSTVVLCIVLHSLMGFAVGRNKAHSKTVQPDISLYRKRYVRSVRDPDDASGKADG